MTRFAHELAAERPDWTAIPEILQRAWQWMEDRGFGEDAPAGYCLTPYDGEDGVMGPVFAPNLTLEGWFDTSHPAHAALLPVAEASVDGGILALWDAGGVEDPSGGTLRAVVLSDGSGFTVADSARDLVRLLAVGYDDLQEFTLGLEREDDEAREAVADFRAWVEDVTGERVPDELPEVDADPFPAWLSQQLGEPSAG